MLPKRPLPQAAAPHPTPDAAHAAEGDDEALEDAASAVTAQRTKDPVLEAIRRVRDIYQKLTWHQRKRVHDFVGPSYIDDADDAVHSN